jgi:hypothetical protein
MLVRDIGPLAFTIAMPLATVDNNQRCTVDIVRDIKADMPALTAVQMMAFLLKYADLQPGLSSFLLQASQLILSRAVAQRPVLGGQSVPLVVCAILGAHDVVGVSAKHTESKFNELDTGIDVKSEDVRICKRNLLRAVDMKASPGWE